MRLNALKQRPGASHARFRRAKTPSADQRRFRAPRGLRAVQLVIMVPLWTANVI